MPLESRLGEIMRTENRTKLPQWDEHKPSLLEHYFELIHENHSSLDSPESDEGKKAFLRGRGLLSGEMDRFTAEGALLFCKTQLHCFHTNVMIVDARKKTDQEQPLRGLSLLELYNQLVRARTLKSLWEQPFSSTSIRDRSWGEKIFFEYPKKAVLEAIAIFLVQQDYEDTAPHYITITPDRVQFQLSSSPNPILEKAFKDMGLGHGVGEGLAYIREALLDNLSYTSDGKLGLEMGENSLTLFRRNPAQSITPSLLRNALPDPSSAVLSPHIPPTVLIPAGSFWMGSYPDDAEAHDNERPRRKITLPEYQIGRYPVTNAQYAAFVRATGHSPPGHWGAEIPPPGLEDHPVVNVNYEDAKAYCRWLSESTGEHYRLPTEEEWEKAARGGCPEERRYPWGDEWRYSVCNTEELGLKGTTSVHEFESVNRSPFGVVDVAGNVWEWTSSWYQGYPGSPHKSPRYGHKYRVVRGGSWAYSAYVARISCRGRYEPHEHRPYLGFRIALNVPPDGK